MHYHVVATGAGSTIYREHSFVDSAESIRFFVDISKELFQETIVQTLVTIEQYLNDAIEQEKHAPVTIGVPNFVLAWLPCESCNMGKVVYN